MLRKMLIAVSAMMLACSPASVCGSQGAQVFKDSAELSASAKSFLSAWLVKRDIREAMRYVAAKPILSKECDLPPDVRRVPRSAGRRRGIVERMLSTTLKSFPRYESVDSAVKPSEIPESDWFEVEDTNAFQIMRIKPESDGSLMCKFDDSAAYNKALLRPGVYYVAFELRNVECCNLSQWISAWAKEGQQWHLISIGLIQD